MAVREPVAKYYVIWSIEHTAWWMPEWSGYTPRLEEAGRYTEEEADKILAQANRGPAGPDTRVNECKIPVGMIL